jgi:hypothetical protein
MSTIDISSSTAAHWEICCTPAQPGAPPGRSPSKEPIIGKVHTVEVLGPFAAESTRIKTLLQDAQLPFDVTLADAGSDYLMYDFEVGEIPFQLIWHRHAMAVRVRDMPPGVKNLTRVYEENVTQPDEPRDLRINTEEFIQMAHVRERLSQLPLVADNPEVFGIIESSSGIMLVDDASAYELRFVEDHYHLLLHVIEGAADDSGDPATPQQLFGYSVPVPLHPVMVDAYLGLIAMKCDLPSAEDLIGQLGSVLIPEQLD